MNTTVNIVLSIAFGIISVLMFMRWRSVKGKVMIQDQQWSFTRIVFLSVGLLSFVNLIMTSENASVTDYVRIAMTIVAVSMYMLARDGVGEEGIISSAKFTPWNEVRGWDYEDRGQVRAVYFTCESTDEKHPDSYKTKELDFAKKDIDILMRFLKMNVSGKYMRMKKKK